MKGISYLKLLGANTNKSLIFLPGLGAFKENYIEFAKSILSSYAAVYIMDLPEQGSKGEWTIGNMVENLKEFINEIDTISLKEIHLGGHSAGAVAILSFQFNMSKKVENVILNSNDKHGLLELMEIEGFGKHVKESEKVTKLFLYSPCDSFANVFPKYFVKKLLNSNKSLVRFVLNICINKPMLIFKHFTTNKKVVFKVTKTKKPQYFGLILNNHKSFFKYIYNYKCIFELKDILDGEMRLKMSNILNDKKIILQFGGFDWLLISKKRSKKDMLSNFKICSNIEIIEHSRLGHFLHKSFSLDLNLNNQMLINKNVVNQSLIHAI